MSDEGEGKNSGVEAALTHFVHTFGARIGMQRAFLGAVLRRLYLDKGFNYELLAEHLNGLQSDVPPNLKDTPVAFQEAAQQEWKTLIEMVELLVAEKSEITDAEKAKRDAKTARLQEARLAKEAAEAAKPPAKTVRKRRWGSEEAMNKKAKK